MSEILKLAKDYEAQLKQQAQITRESVKTVLSMHEDVLTECLSTEQKKIEHAISAHSKRMTSILAQSWLTTIIILVAILLIVFGVMWWQSKMILANKLEINHQMAVIAELKSKGGEIQLSKCGDQKRLCIKIDLAEMSYGNNGVYPWKIPQGY